MQSRSVSILACLTKVVIFGAVLNGSHPINGMYLTSSELPKHIANYWNTKTAQHKQFLKKFKKNYPIITKQQHPIVNNMEQTLSQTPSNGWSLQSGNLLVTLSYLFAKKTDAFGEIKKIIDNEAAKLESNKKELQAALLNQNATNSSYFSEKDSKTLLQNNQTLQLFISKIETRIESLDTALKEAIFSLTNGRSVASETIHVIEQQFTFILNIIALIDYTTELENEADKLCQQQDSLYWVVKEIFEEKVKELISQETNQSTKMAIYLELLEMKDTIFDCFFDTEPTHPSLKTFIEPIANGLASDYEKYQNVPFKQYLESHHKNLADSYGNYDQSAPLTYNDYLELRHDALMFMIEKHRLTDQFPEIVPFIQNFDIAYEKALYHKYSNYLQEKYEAAEADLFQEINLRINRLEKSDAIIKNLKTNLSKSTTYVAVIRKFALSDKKIPASYMDYLVDACTKQDNNNFLQKMTELYQGKTSAVTIALGAILGANVTKKLSSFKTATIANTLRKFHFNKLPTQTMLVGLNPEEAIESISQKTISTKNSLEKLGEDMAQPSSSWAGLVINPVRERIGDIFSSSSTSLDAITHAFIKNIKGLNTTYKNVVTTFDNCEDQIKLALFFTAREQQFILYSAAKKNAAIKDKTPVFSQKTIIDSEPDLIKEKEETILTSGLPVQTKEYPTTILVSHESAKNTLLRMSPSLKKNILTKYQRKFETSIQKGAQLCWDIISDGGKNAETLALNASHEEVMDLLTFIYSRGGDARPDQCCPQECIIDILEGNEYFAPLCTFFLSYQNNFEEKQKKSKTVWNIPPIEVASTKGAHRYNYVTSESQTHPDKVVNRFRVFHVRIDTINGKKTLEIKPERYGKSGIYNRITTKITKTDDDGPLFNKKFVPAELTKIFSEALKMLNVPGNSNEPSNVDAMYKRLKEIEPTKKRTRKILIAAINAFRGEAAKENWSHLTERVGKEIILGPEELFVAYFSELNHKNDLLSKEWKNACKILHAFKNLKQKIGFFIHLNPAPTWAEQEIEKEISYFYELICGPQNIRDSIKDAFIRDYLLSTAFLLKKIALNVHPPMSNEASQEFLMNAVISLSPGRKLQKLLLKPIFEQSYQLSKFSVETAKKEIAQEINEGMVINQIKK